MKNRLYSILYMFAITFACTAIVTGIYAANENRIALNEKTKLSKVILNVLDIKAPLADKEVIRTFKNRVQQRSLDGRLYYRGMSQDGKSVIGYAFPLQGAGLWGQIYGMMGVDTHLKKVLGVAFYKHSETPGLGGRITEPWFVDQFKGKGLELGGKKDMYFYLVPQGEATGPHEVDAITGATLTSNGVERFMNRDLKEYLPIIAKKEGLKVSTTR
jgi:Na+-transporting NADH:ubiquinone oxidoreductase subunit C